MEFDGIGSFVDNSLMVLCAQYHASMEDPTDASWLTVSRALQTLLQHPVTDDERVALRWVDVHHFSPAICHHRAQYIIWRSTKQRADSRVAKHAAAEAPEPSGFNILKESIKADVDQLMEEARRRLPSSKPSPSDDEDDDKPVAVFRPPPEMLIEVDPAQAEAEAALLQRVQELQLEHYKKFKKWVDAGPLVSTDVHPAQLLSSANGSAKNRSGLVSEDAVEDIPLEKQTTQNVAALMDYLGIGEHKSKFRRSTGKLLLQLTKGDVRERFGDDFEAADILWTYIDENRSTANQSNKAASAAAKKLYDEARAPSTALRQRTTNLQAFEAQTADARARQRMVEQHIAAGDLQALKRAMNPYRPARPSARVEAYDCSTSEDDAVEAYGRRYLSAVHSDGSKTSTPIDTPEKKARPAQEKPVAADAKSSTSATVVAARPTTAPSRAGRWQVQEYDDVDASD